MALDKSRRDRSWLEGKTLEIMPNKSKRERESRRDKTTVWPNGEFFWKM